MMKQIEMGGYLPLELRKGPDRFHKISDENILAVNTGRTAIWYAVCSLGGKRLHVPYFYCPDVTAMLQTMRIEIVFYHIDQYLMPLNLKVQDDDIVLLVNYYGIMNHTVCNYAQTFEKVIIDQSHGFFYEPLMRRGIMNVYSCRKFIGVPDGAYLIGEDLISIDLEKDLSYNRMRPLCKSIELGTNSGYEEHKENEHILAEKRLQMSVLTRRILENADYDKIVYQRCQNFWFLHERLKKKQNFEITEKDSIPYMYPLLLNRDYHQEFVKQQIYIPILWSQLLSREWEGTLEQRYSGCMVLLPIDQRYTKKEMAYLIQIIESLSS